MNPSHRAFAGGGDSDIAAALQVVWRAELERMEQLAPQVLAAADDEALHQFRVSLRRTRALLKCFATWLPPHAGCTAELKWLARATGPARDFDVQCQALRVWAEAPPPRVLAPVLGALGVRRDAAHAALARVLMGARYKRLLVSWRRFIETLPGDPQLPPQLPAAEAVRAVLAREFGGLLKRGRRIDAGTPPGDLHRLRIGGKRTRYVLEVFAGLLGTHRDADKLLAALRDLQTVLGDYHDGGVAVDHCRWLTRQLAGRDLKPATWLELGRWLRELELRRQAARDAYPGCFKTFSRRCDRHLGALLTSAADGGH